MPQLEPPDNSAQIAKRYRAIPATLIILAAASTNVLGGDFVATVEPNLTTAVVLRAAAPSVSPVLGNIDDVAWLAAFLVLASLTRGIDSFRNRSFAAPAEFIPDQSGETLLRLRRSGISFHHGGLYGP